MPTMQGKTALLELLKQEGARVMFGNPGTTELPLMDAFAVEHELRYVLALQEAPAMGMADGYAQASGNIAVVNLHVAPGLGNAMGMLYDAQKAGSPILVTASATAFFWNSLGCSNIWPVALSRAAIITSCADVSTL